MPKIIAPSFYFIGNHTALDYINTKITVNGKPADLLKSWDDLLKWLSLSSLLTAEQISAVKDKWPSQEADSAVKDAIELRTSLLSMVRQSMLGDELAEEDLGRVNRILINQVVTTRLVRTGNRFAVERQTEFRSPSDLLIPIAEAAVDLFAYYDFGLVKKCGNPDCVLYFYDHSKNGIRRWCSPKTCGNRMKVTAFLKRRKSKEAEAE
ncbi:CGNR zinc finger domain-containing protein [Paenibacillus gansuensis]|uniref:CGNR zinc finger domain-containing protein n=1 Tax=Paenibacillus gansuensis TaxID=306542 RepID=A0ABW5PHP9_9BACL